jgi:hypothetical protein
MKKILLSFFTAIALNFIISAQDFKEILQNTVTMFDTAATTQDMFAATNRLELISKKWDTIWAAHYYCTYANIIISYVEPDAEKKDGYIDKADEHLKKVKELVKKENDELFVISAFIASARLSVKPQSRWKKYGEIFNAEIDSAKILRADNPRIYYLQGNSVYYTPKMFGGGEKNALPYYQKAEELYKNENDSDIYKPSWGKKQNSVQLEKCKTAEKE